ncbi:MAG: type 4a pilus biogenesis protein PilO [Desulfobacteraceae bacterium]|nr:type 4a pilus biogenesis protein PilO [Desulfobacteraceae bacterium]
MKNATISTSSMATLFAKIEELTKPQRIAIFTGTLVVIIGLSVYLLFWPKYNRIDQLEQQLKKVQSELETAKKNASELNDWRNKMKKKESEYKTVMRELPEKEEIPSLLAGISQAGKDAGLEFLLFAPKPEVPKDFYAEIAVDMSISGTYHQVAVFFDKVANLQRIVNIRGIKMTPSSQKDQGGNALTTTCQAVTYKFIEAAQKPKQANKPQPQAKTEE